MHEFVQSNECEAKGDERMTGDETEDEEYSRQLQIGRAAGDAVTLALAGTDTAYVLVMYVPGYGMQVGSNVFKQDDVIEMLKRATATVENHNPDHKSLQTVKVTRHDA